tara:strand:+ start:158 stop:385 length:228 start_codon:yes stop_codon:yes gene_type:complete
MNKEKYEELILRFTKELHDVGVTENMKKLTEAQYIRAPNIASTLVEETTRKFSYMHDGYEIQAVQTIKLSVRKCK